MSMTFGNDLQITLFGSSHGDEVGVVIAGLPGGIPIDMNTVQSFVTRRSSKNNVGSTARRESDAVEIVSGISKGVTTGYEIKAIIKNSDVKKGEYEKYDSMPRPSHADYVAHIKYGKAIEGGGIFSGRMTAPLCVAGAIAIQVLKSYGVDVFGYISELGGVKGASFRDDLSVAPKRPVFGKLPLLNNSAELKMLTAIDVAGRNGDSLGGVVECVVTNLPVGVGEPFFRSLESRISSALFSVPAVKGVDFGKGFDFGHSKGSEVNDGFFVSGDNILTKTNNNGGINGGLSNGMPLLVSVAVKPTSSITIEQDTVNLKTKENTKIKIAGRHDVTIVPRAVPCVESAIAIAVLDLMIKGSFIKIEKSLNTIRTEIDKVDDKMAELLVERQELSRKMGLLKSEQDINIVDETREHAVVQRVAKKASGILPENIERIYNVIFEMSRAGQKSVHTKSRCERVFLIGTPLAHSFSPEIHNKLGKYDYGLKELQIGEVETFLNERQFDALNVTVPYKRLVASLVHELDEIALRTGVVNTVKREGNILKGYNTDYFGFKYLLESEKVHVKGKKVVILGSHGTAMTVTCVMEDMGARDVIQVPHEDIHNLGKMSELFDADILVNGTPVGMYPMNDDLVADISVFGNLSCVIDVIYNPYNTRLLIEARKRKIKAINGLKMLAAQAKASAEIFSNTKIDNKVIAEIYGQIRKESLNIVFIGMGGSGKSTVAAQISNDFNMEFVDTDKLIENKTGKNILQIFDEQMEEGFRKLEKEVINEVAKTHNKVIATGGGSVVDAENCERLRANGILVYIKCNPDQIDFRNRPCYASRESAKRIYAKRSRLYETVADVTVENHIFKKSIKELVEEVKNGIAGYQRSES